MSYKVYEAINSNLFGLNRTERNSGDYQLHPLIRDDWRSVDRFRDLQGNAPALVRNNNGDLIVDERVSISGQPYGSSFFRPFKDNSGVYDEPNATTSDTIEVTITVKPDNAEWNQGNSFTNDNDALENLLEQNDFNGNFAGIPYFEKFFYSQNTDEPYGLLTTDARMAGATRNIKPIMQQDGWSAGRDPANPILNHKFNYRYYDRTVEDPIYNIEIESKYNLFLDTSPDYESVINNIPEPLIPNYYHVEASINTAAVTGDSPFPAYNIFDASAINVADYVDVLVGALSGTNIEENQNISQGYLQFYCNNINNFDSNYMTNFGNVAVLSHDVSVDVLSGLNTATRDNRGTLSDTTDDLLAIDSYPFYNKITIPYANQWGLDAIFDALKADSMLGDKWTQFFVTLLELLIVENYSLGAPAVPSRGFTIYDTNDGNKVIAQNTSVDLAIRIEDVINALLDGSGDLYDQIEDIFSQGAYNYFVGQNTNDYPGASFILHEVDLTDPDNFFERFNTWYLSPNLQTELQQALEVIAGFRNGSENTFRFIYKGLGGVRSNHNDTPIMYMVEKRVIPTGQLAADLTTPPVQRFFFGRDITGGQKGIVYYDTQIKYGVRYQYDIRQVRIVVGESYYYDSVLSITNAGSVHQGRALGNVLGIYAEENVDITTTQTFQIANSLGNENIGQAFEYTEEDAEPPPVRMTNAVSIRKTVGYYVYEMPPPANFGDASNIDDIFGAAMVAPSGLASAWGPIRSPSAQANLNNLFIEVKVGEGFDGNASGGAIPANTKTLLEFGDQTPLISDAEQEQLAPIEIRRQAAATLVYWPQIVATGIGIEMPSVSDPFDPIFDYDERSLWITPFRDWLTIENAYYGDLGERTLEEFSSLINIFEQYRQDVGGFTPGFGTLQGLALRDRASELVDDLRDLGIDIPRIGLGFESFGS